MLTKNLIIWQLRHFKCNEVNSKCSDLEVCPTVRCARVTTFQRTLIRRRTTRLGAYDIHFTFLENVILRFEKNILQSARRRKRRRELTPDESSGEPKKKKIKTDRKNVTGNTKFIENISELNFYSQRFSRSTGSDFTEF